MNRRDDNRGQNRPGEGAAGRDMGRNKFTTKMQRKLVVLFLLVLLAFAGLSARLILINRDKGESYEKQVLSQQQYSSKTIPYKRGEILDSKGTKLAVSEKVYDLVLDCKQMNAKEEYVEPTLQALEDYFGADKAQVRAYAQENPSSQYYVIKKQMTWDEISAYQEMMEDPERTEESANIAGIWFEESYRRVYPNNTLACDVIGFTRSDGVGLYGLEEYYNDTLSGVNGRQYGYLDTDENLQRTTRAAVDALSGEERAAALQLAQQTQWRNKAVSDLYEPGSVFKLITCAAGLDAGVIQAGSTFYCGESISVAGTKFHCANHKSHGTQSVTLALMNSCNQSFIQIGARLGKEAFCDYFAAFGLREATGIDLPAEPKKSLYYTAEQMGPVELASCAFGQSSKVSYIEMAAAVCAVVNGGNLMRPYVVSEIVDPEGETLDKIEPVCTRRVIKEETSITMRKMMEAVVEGGGGQNAKIAGYRVGGKSGTSQKLDSEDETARIASFVAVAPIDDPQFLCLVCLDEPHSWTTAGGSLSAPVCAEVLEQTLVYKGVPRAPAEDEAQNTAETAAELPADGDSFYGA